MIIPSTRSLLTQTRSIHQTPRLGSTLPPRFTADHAHQRRLIHISPPISSLPFSVDHGLAPFLSSTAIKTLAIDWQEGLLDRLNQIIKGTAVENKSLFDTIVDLAKDRTQVIPFNLASEALNNSFFLNGLKKPETRPLVNRPSEGSSLAAAIEDTYGSFTQFISYFSNAAIGMSSSGYIWLVCDQDGTLGICATFGGGTVLVQNRQQRGDWPKAIGSAQIGLDRFGRPLPDQHPEDPHTHTQADAGQTAGSGVRMFSSSSWVPNTTPKITDLKTGEKPKVSFADSLFTNPTHSNNHSNRPSGLTSSGTQNRAITRKNTNPAERFNQLHPLLNLAVAERAYLMDYGVWGKESYVKKFWMCVNWDKVEEAYLGRAPKSSALSYSSIWRT